MLSNFYKGVTNCKGILINILEYVVDNAFAGTKVARGHKCYVLESKCTVRSTLSSSFLYDRKKKHLGHQFS